MFASLLVWMVRIVKRDTHCFCRYIAVNKFIKSFYIYLFLNDCSVWMLVFKIQLFKAINVKYCFLLLVVKVIYILSVVRWSSPIKFKIELCIRMLVKVVWSCILVLKLQSCSVFVIVSCLSLKVYCKYAAQLVLLLFTRHST